jgi:GAF domain-containing protein
MAILEKPANEIKRLEAIHRYRILDTPPDGAFDRITELASVIFKVPIAIISLVDEDRIWFKSHHGLNVNQIGRDPGLCASAILSEDLYVLNDASVDPRSLSNPLVAGNFGLRFYAAMPLRTSDDFNLGTLCIIDKEPRQFTNHEREILKQLTKLVMEEMELRIHLRDSIEKIRSLTNDISFHLDETLSSLSSPSENSYNSDEIREHLEASKIFLGNIENQIMEL